MSVCGGGSACGWSVPGGGCECIAAGLGGPGGGGGGGALSAEAVAGDLRFLDARGAACVTEGGSSRRRRVWKVPGG